jgi:hypothetical protein
MEDYPMRKTSLCMVIIGLLVCSSIFLAAGQLVKAQTGTQISGILTTDATWTSANSPYTLSGNLLVNNSAVLTIESGVTVKLNNYYIMVNGTLQAHGTVNNPITFDGGQITITPFSAGWSQADGTGSIIENALVHSALTVSNSAYINNNKLLGTVTVSNQINDTGHLVLTQIPSISNNTINNGITVNNNGAANICGNTINGCSTGISQSTWWLNSGTTLIENNVIVNNTCGVAISEWVGGRNTVIIRNNTIANNGIGIYISYSSNDANLNVTAINNNIYGNTNYNFKNQNPGNINATSNYWGTMDNQKIDQSIYDFKNDFTLGTVTIAPVLDSPNTQAPTFANASAGIGGSIAPNGIVYLKFGGSQTFNITPNAGYHIADVLVNGTSIGDVNSYFVHDVSGAVTISASFAPNPTPTPTTTLTPTAPPTVTATPTITAQPTNTPESTLTPTYVPTTTPSPSPTASESPTTEPSPSVPEFPALSILPLLAGAAVAIFFAKKKSLKAT